LDAADCCSCGKEEGVHSLLLSAVLVKAAATIAGECAIAVASSGVTNATGTFDWKPATGKTVRRQERPARAAHSIVGARLIVFMVTLIESGAGGK